MTRILESHPDEDFESSRRDRSKFVKSRVTSFQMCANAFHSFQTKLNSSSSSSEHQTHQRRQQQKALNWYLPVVVLCKLIDTTTIALSYFCFSWQSVLYISVFLISLLFLPEMKHVSFRFPACYRLIAHGFIPCYVHPTYLKLNHWYWFLVKVDNCQIIGVYSNHLHWKFERNFIHHNDWEQRICLWKLTGSWWRHRLFFASDASTAIRNTWVCSSVIFSYTLFLTCFDYTPETTSWN